MHAKPLRTTVLAITAAAAALFAMATPAQAADSSPCGARFSHVTDGTTILVRYCPDWAPNNQVPVYRYGRSTGDSDIVGYIDARGNDWYVCQANTGNRYTLGSYTNVYWASTKADNGEWGWVSEVYFQGGNNNKKDGNLETC